MSSEGSTGSAPVSRVGGFGVSVAVITHAARRDVLSLLARRLPDVAFTVHSGGAVTPSPDDALAGALSAWRAVRPGATHHLVLQDDVIPCDGFLGHLGAALRCRPNQGFSLFAEWGSKTAQVIRMAALTGAGWANVADPWLPAPAVILPADTARGFAEFLAERISLGEKRDAFLLLRFLNSREQDGGVCVPNLVQHDVPFAPSLLPNGKVRGPRRTACLAASARASADPWPAGVTPLPRELPYHSPHDLTASLLSDWDGDYGWHTTPAFSWLARHGYDHLAVNELLADAVGSVGLDLHAGPVGFDSIRESWLSAFTVGWVAAGNGTRLRLGDAGADPSPELVLTAVRSMAAGPLRRVLSPRLLDEWAGRAAPLLLAALAQGERAGLRTAGEPR